MCHLRRGHDWLVGPQPGEDVVQPLAHHGVRGRGQLVTWTIKVTSLQTQGNSQGAVQCTVQYSTVYSTSQGEGAEAGQCLQQGRHTSQQVVVQKQHFQILVSSQALR